MRQPRAQLDAWISGRGRRVRGCLARGSVIALLMAVTACGLRAGVIQVASASDDRVYRIDAEIWAPAAEIRWPGDRVGVRVYYAVDKLAADYGIAETRVQDPAQMRLGQLEDDLVVLLPPGELPSGHVIDFASAHEAFHLAAQYYGARIRTDKLVDMPVVSDKDAVSAFWEEIESQASGALAGSGEIDCGRIRSAFDALDEIDKVYVLHRAFWEWPAEFYARVWAFGYGTGGAYPEARSMIRGDNRVYTSGSTAMLYVHKRSADRSWQWEIASGRNAIDVFMRAGGCADIEGEGLSVRVKRIDFFDPPRR